MPKTKKYDKSKLNDAIQDIQNGSESYRSAEKKYGIPKSTLEFKIKHPGHKETFGPAPILTFDEENFLEQWMKDNAAKGFPRKANDLTNSVQKFLSANPRPHNFKNNRPGDGWVKGFLKRHPTISKRSSEGVTAASACLSEQDIRNWFSNISDYIKEKNLEDAFQDPSRIFNGDESGFQVCPTTGKVFAEKGSKNVYSIERSSSKENITVMFTFSADGNVSVPMIIYPYQRIPEKIARSINPKWGIGRSENGWMTSETFYQYIANVFYPFVKSLNIKFPVILFLDGHKSHLNYQLSLLCNELQIEIIALYPNATRILQPCDVSIFRPLKEAWRQTVREWEDQHPQEIKVSFAPLLEKAMNLGIKKETIIHGFRACGIFPFDANAVDYTKCLGKKLEEQTVISETPKQSQYLDYKTFSEIVGEENIELFNSFSQNREVQGDFFDLLFKVWEFFRLRDENKTEKTDSENGTKAKPQINVIQNIVIKSPIKHLHIETAAHDSENDNMYFQPSTSKIIVENKFLGNFLTSPNAPITSERYQEMFKKKQDAKEEQEKQKQERKRKREELEKQKEEKKIERKEQKNQKMSKKGKKLKLINECTICHGDIKSDEIHCDDCKKFYHIRCIPQHYKHNLPIEDDLFICHNCYEVDDNDSDGIIINEDEDDDELDQLYEQYNTAQEDY